MACFTDRLIKVLRLRHRTLSLREEGCLVRDEGRCCMQHSARLPCDMRGEGLGLGIDWQVVGQLTFDPSFPQLPVVSWLVLVYGDGVHR